jgi:DNA-binding transcriptional ArsR family regulator
MNPVAVVGHALADETRLLIFGIALEHHAISVSDIAEIAGCTVSNVSYHLRALREAGLVQSRRSGVRVLVMARHDRWRLVRDAIAACTCLQPPVRRDGNGPKLRESQG